MPETLPPPRAVLFDAYGTLFDVYSVSELAERLFPGSGPALGVLWRDKQIEYSRLVTTSDHGAHYRPFRELTEAALQFAIKKIAEEQVWTRCAADFASEIAQLMRQYDALQAFGECAGVLRTLKARGVVTGVLSNGDPPMLASAIASAGLDGLLDHVLSVDAVRRYKTHPDAYALGPRATGFAAGEIAFVSCNGWDALAATWYGYRTLWINRYRLPFEELGTQPERTGSDLRDALAFFPP